MFTHQERHTHPRHIYGSKGFHNTNPHMREISLLMTYTQEDESSLRHHPSISRLSRSLNGLP